MQWARNQLELRPKQEIDKTTGRLVKTVISIRQCVEPSSWPPLLPRREREIDAGSTHFPFSRKLLPSREYKQACTSMCNCMRPRRGKRPECRFYQYHVEAKNNSNSDWLLFNYRLRCAGQVTKSTFLILILSRLPIALASCRLASLPCSLSLSLSHSRSLSTSRARTHAPFS
ncbi:unnamed protein product [Protopolystoma xenopodis]|uniref:Uncharacterized protein n=1 Tax=Protopolystoma xenopodis TaxID=117903 RepID=A0A448WBD6_9PLAT|nr:unnamed protein product [Protopolystoma xenopodis]